MISTANIKIIIVDLDKTLLHTDKTLSEYTINVLNECKKHGFKIMVATARPLRTAIQYCDLIDFDAMVVSNGARIIYQNQQTDYGIYKRRQEGHNISDIHDLLALKKNYPEYKTILHSDQGTVYASKKYNELLSPYFKPLSQELEEWSKASYPINPYNYQT